MLEMDSSQFLAVGDGVNDIPMFEFADFSILISAEKTSGQAKLVLPDIHQALQYILENEQ
jgi:phosphoserine phosphatase